MLARVVGRLLLLLLPSTKNNDLSSRSSRALHFNEKIRSLSVF